MMVIKNIKGLVQVRSKPPLKVAGEDMQELPVLEDAFLIIKNGLIEDYGRMEEYHEQFSDSSGFDDVIDASGRYILPGFVDSHTHLVFAAYREEEFVDKIKGMSYAEIAARGGGILNSAERLRIMSEEDLFNSSVKRAWEVLSYGTAALEIKSGYGLSLKEELKMLRVARRIGQETPLAVKTTFLGAHAFPKNRSRKGYIGEIMDKMIPQVAEEGLADFIDVFCEEGFFSPSETEKIVNRGIEYGLVPKIHANQLNNSGGVQVGVKTGALSVDHLESIGREEIEILSGSKTMPTLLPGAAFYLNMTYPPAREMIEAGLPVAIASDFNPGSAPSGNMPQMISLACIKMRMTPEEAFNAATINGAYAMGLSEMHGSITRGKKGSVLITKEIPSLAFVPYAFGSSSIDRVVIDGKIEFSAGK